MPFAVFIGYGPVRLRFFFRFRNRTSKHYSRHPSASSLRQLTPAYRDAHMPSRNISCPPSSLRNLSGPPFRSDSHPPSRTQNDSRPPSRSDSGPPARTQNDSRPPSRNPSHLPSRNGSRAASAVPSQGRNSGAFNSVAPSTVSAGRNNQDRGEQILLSISIIKNFCRF